MYRGAFAIAVLAFATSAQAASVVDQVPRDSLGFVVVRNLSQTDAKIARAAGALRVAIPSPLTMLKAMTGVSAGVDLDRDLLLVMLPPENSSRPFHLAVWLPVKDYDALVRSLDGDPQRRIAPATIAGEDVLIAHVADWAVIMDPDQRDRLSQMAGGEAPAKQPAADTAQFIDPDSDISLVVLSPGMQMAGSWLASEGAMKQSASDATTDEHGRIVPLQPEVVNDNSWRAAWQSVQSMLADAQELKRTALEAHGFGCGLRFDDAGNAVFKCRIALSPGSEPSGNGQSVSTSRAAGPGLYDNGQFWINGSGTTSERWVQMFVGPYLRQLASDLAAGYNTKVDEADMAKFRSVVERAATQMRAVSILARPGDDQQGVYTDSFLAVHVASADDFLTQSKAAMDQWNAMLAKADSGVSLVFETSAFTVDGHDGSEYSIDMAKAVGAPPLPETRQSMERLFGPGGRFRLQFTKVDGSTVLISMATQDQLLKPIQAILGAPQSSAKDDGKTQSASQLLTGDADWRLYFSLDGYNHWLKRQMEAIVGPVIGGPIVRPFPESPPIGAAGGAAQNMVWAEVAIPADTLRGIGQFLHP
jgi:hypothetical protein